MRGHNQGQFTGSHSARGITKARKLSQTNFKNMSKTPNPVKQDKAALKREKRRERNLNNKYAEFWGRWYQPRPKFKDIWLYGMPGMGK